MLKRRRRGIHGFDEVEEHVGVRRHRLGRIRALGDGQIEQMRDVRERPEFGLAVGRIEKIHGDVPVVTGNPRLAARHRNDIPATLLKQVGQHVTAGQAGGTRDKCSTLHLGHLSSLLYVAPACDRGRNFTSAAPFGSRPVKPDLGRHRRIVRCP
jgi:hypothetical protein